MLKTPYWRLSLLVLVFVAQAARAEDDAKTEERLKELERQNKEILERLEESENRNKELSRKMGALQEQRQRQLKADIDGYLSATSKDVSIETKKGAFLTFYGFLRLDMYYNTARFNSVIVPVFVLPETPGNHNNDQFALDVRLTRVGMLLNFGSVGNLKGTGKLEIDFANFPNGVPESRETPRIRLAYIQIDSEKWMLRLGQDWDIISPQYPNVNHEGVMWFAGNLGDRRPMIRGQFRPNQSFTVDAALGLTGAVDNRDLDGDGERDGIDSGLPHLQVRASWARPMRDRELVIGVMGFLGFLEASAGLPAGGETDFTSWGVGFDFLVPVGKVITVRGEVWFGQALADMRGTAANSVNPTTGQEVEGYGGWVEAVFRPNEKWQFYLGGTIDNPDDGQVPANAVTNNWTGYVGARRHWTKRFRTTFDIIYWETKYQGGGLGNAIRVNIWVSWDF